MHGPAGRVGPDIEENARPGGARQGDCEGRSANTSLTAQGPNGEGEHNPRVPGRNESIDGPGSEIGKPAVHGGVPSPVGFAPRTCLHGHPFGAGYEDQSISADDSLFVRDGNVPVKMQEIAIREGGFAAGNQDRGIALSGRCVAPRSPLDRLGSHGAIEKGSQTFQVVLSSPAHVRIRTGRSSPRPVRRHPDIRARGSNRRSPTPPGGYPHRARCVGCACALRGSG